MMRIAVLTAFVLAAAACASVGEPTDEALEGATPREPVELGAAGSAAPAESAQLFLRGVLADGRTVGFAASGDHVIVAVGDEITVLDGTRGALVTSGLGDGASGWAMLKLESTAAPRAVFGLAWTRHETPGGARVWLEGTGTVGDQDLDVTGALVVAAPHDDVLLAVDATWALAVVNGVADVVLPEGTVGGELVPAYTIDRVVAADDLADGLRRELAVVRADARELPAAHQYLVECGE